MNILVRDFIFDVEVIYKRSNKRTYLRAYKPNKVKITTPRKLSEKDIIKYLEQCYDNFLKYYSTLEQVKEKSNKIHYLGSEYDFNYIYSKYSKIEIIDNTMNFYCRTNDDKALLRLLNDFYNKTLQSIVEENINQIKVKFNYNKPIDFKYKNVKTYFGQCAHKKGIITLSSMLCKYELKYIISVIYHEMAHFYYHNHQQGFYSLLESVYPNYKSVQHNLRKIKYFDYL